MLIQAVEFGAEGIGLCRTEHMFFDEDRIPAMREMIVSKTEEQRRAALAKLLPFQKKDFIGIYEAMQERACYHPLPGSRRCMSSCPPRKRISEALAKEMNLTYDELKATIDSLHEFNPMLGHRGCRLAVTYPEIAEMQTRAVVEAAIEVSQATGKTIVPEIMIPLVGEVKELKYVKDIVMATANKVMEEKGVQLKIMVGTMIEIPRAALTGRRDCARRLNSSPSAQTTLPR